MDSTVLQPFLLGFSKNDACGIKIPSKARSAIRHLIKLQPTHHILMSIFESESEILTSSETHENNVSSIMPGPSITPQKHKILSVAFALYTLIVGRMISTQPEGAKWSFFSWHPFLMVTGFIGLMGISSVTKKLGGYTNTKLHGILASLGLISALAGLYVIWKNKEIHGKDHITTTHALMGIITVACAVGPAIVGAVFLHPDFGMDKTNQQFRFAHKWFGRVVIASAYVTGFFGLKHMTSDIWVLLTYAVPLMILGPMTLLD
jgi:hypothetical protein